MAKKKNNRSFNVELLQLCDYAMISRENKLSVIGIFDQILVANTPANHPRLFIVSVISGQSNDNYSINLDIKAPSGVSILPTQKLNGQLGPNGTSNLIAEIGNVQLPEKGTYSIQLSTPESFLATKVFEVLTTGGAYGGRREASRQSN